MSTPAPFAPQPTLLLIPDISGFTRFVSATEITHSQHIIEEVLGALIDANEIGLTVSEIEGDAVLFYRPGPAPSAVALLSQVRAMYVQFHAHLRRYETHRICQCGACSTASGLTLKIVGHAGEVGLHHVRGHAKLFGRAVIEAHRLLKNEVPSNEYALFTDALVHAAASDAPFEAAWASAEAGTATYDVGPLAYRYVSLTPLRAEVPEPTLEDYSLPNSKVRVLSHEARIDAPLDLVFDVVSDLAIRHHWQEGLKGSDRLSHALTQHGATHRCVINDSERDPFLVSHDFRVEEDVVTFTDTEARRRLVATVYRLRRIDAATTLVEHHFFVRNRLMALLFRLLFVRRIRAQTARSYKCLGAYCAALQADGSGAPSHIALTAVT